jgi:hypothetical protein
MLCFSMFLSIDCCTCPVCVVVYSFSFNVYCGEDGELYPWRLFEERVRTGPFGLSR